MGKPRPKLASPPDLHLMGEVLQSKGYKALGEVKDRTYGFRDAEGNRIYLDDTGWTSFDTQGNETDFGAHARDLAAYLKKQNPLQLGDEDTKFLKSLRIGTHRYKKAVGLQNQGQAGAVCPNCHQPIRDGEMVLYQAGGTEAHAQCPAGAGTQPGQQQPGWQSRLNLPKNFKPPQQPAQPTHTPGMINPNVGKPTASLLKKGDMPRYLDEEWRNILEANGFAPEPSDGSGDEDEIWHKTNSEVGVLIGIDEEEDEPFWAEIDGHGDIGLISSDTEELKQLIEAKPAEPALDQPDWTTDEKSGEKVPKFEGDDAKFLKDFRMKGSKLPIKVTNVAGKFAGKPPKGFAFVVPMAAAGKVAFHLAKAGLDEFETINYDEDASTVFVFKTEPELHVAEEIVRAEFADQIGGKKEQWLLWAPEAKDPSELPSPEQHGYAQASKVAAESLESLLRDALAELHQCEEDMDYHSDVADRIEVFFADKKPAHPEEGFMRGKQFSGPRLVEGAERGEEIGELMRGGKKVYYAYVNGVREESEDREAVRKKLESRHPKQAFEKRALDANLATFVGTFVASMLVKWLGDEYAKRWGNLAQAATAKTEAALQEKGVYDLGTLDKYAEESGKNRSSALLSLAGRSLALAVVMTTGIAAQKLFSGEEKAQAAPAVAEQVQTPDITLSGPAEAWQKAPAPKPHRQTKEQLKQQQKQHDQQVMDQIHQQDKDRNPQNIV